MFQKESWNVSENPRAEITTGPGLLVYLKPGTKKHLKLQAAAPAVCVALTLQLHMLSHPSALSLIFSSFSSLCLIFI